MKNLLIISLLLSACATTEDTNMVDPSLVNSSTVGMTAEATTTPPWESLHQPEKNYYKNTLKCPETSAFIDTVISTYTLFLSVDVGLGHFNNTYKSPDFHTTVVIDMKMVGGVLVPVEGTAASTNITVYSPFREYEKQYAMNHGASNTDADALVIGDWHCKQP